MKKEMIERFKRERKKIFGAVDPTDWVNGDNAIEITVKIPKSLRDVLEDWTEEEISELIRVLAFMGNIAEFLKGILRWKRLFY